MNKAQRNIEGKSTYSSFSYLSLSLRETAPFESPLRFFAVRGSFILGFLRWEPTKETYPVEADEWRKTEERMPTFWKERKSAINEHP